MTLKRREGEALADGGDIYDALLEDYEPETTAAEIETIFNAMRPGLVRLREAALARPERPALTGRFAAKAQMDLSRDLAQVFGYDLDRGRIDQGGASRSPRGRARTCGSPPAPARTIPSTASIRRSTRSAMPVTSRISNRPIGLTPLGRGVSMGVHESQSRIYENQLGRSRAFCGWLYGRMRDAFGPECR